ncbi:MAG: radical SAM protein, partial [bacterium]|nr:radical SAM protein [bacterium]
SIGADYYINSSQGETTLVSLIHSLKKKQPVTGINNIYYKSGDSYSATPVLKEDNKLSENRVDWELFADGIDEYATIRTAISCPFSCSFCGFPQHAGKYQVTEVHHIEEELVQLAGLGKVKNLHFIDDTFNIPEKRFKEILRMMIKNRFEFKWHSYFRCQFADRETVELMKESGCEGVFLGLESGNDQILENMNKATTTGKYRKGIQLLKKNGIVTFGNFIIGFPGETHQTVRDTIDFIEESGLDFYRVQLWYCEPITPIWQQRTAYKLEGKSFEWRHATMDAKTACDYIDEIFLSVRNSTWVPQYNFDFDNLWHLVHRGMSLSQLKTLLDAFNSGIKEKLREPDRIELSFESEKNIAGACRWNQPVLNHRDPESEQICNIEADFDF